MIIVGGGGGTPLAEEAILGGHVVSGEEHGLQTQVDWVLGTTQSLTSRGTYDTQACSSPL